MSEGSGWVKIYRQMLENPIITKTNAHISVWIHLLLNAAHKETDVLFSGRRFTIVPGQLVTTRARLCSIAKEETLTERQIRTILEDFEQEGQITKEAQKGNRGGMLITISKWAEYQTGDRLTTDYTNGRTTDYLIGRETPTEPVTARDLIGQKNAEQTDARHLENKLSTGPATVCRPISDRQNNNVTSKENNNNNIYINNPPATNARGREEEPPKAPEGFEYSGRDPETGKPLYRKLNPTEEDIDAFFEYFRQHPETKIILRSEEEIKQ